MESKLELIGVESYGFALSNAVFSYDIVVPIFNEIKELGILLEELNGLTYHNFIKNIILIDDGSLDGSREFLNKITINNKIKIIYHRENLGRASVIRTSQPFLTSNFIIFHNSDRKYPIKNILEMVKAVEYINYKAQVKVMHLIGVRKINMCNLYKDISVGSFLANKIIVWLSDGVSDIFSGSRIIDKNLLMRMDLYSNRFEFEAEIVFKTLKFGEVIHEISIDYFSRTIANSKKIKWYDFVKIIFMCVKIIFVR